MIWWFANVKLVYSRTGWSVHLGCSCWGARPSQLPFDWWLL